MVNNMNSILEGLNSMRDTLILEGIEKFTGDQLLKAINGKSSKKSNEKLEKLRGDEVRYNGVVGTVLRDVTLMGDVWNQSEVGKITNGVIASRDRVFIPKGTKIYMDQRGKIWVCTKKGEEMVDGGSYLEVDTLKKNLKDLVIGVTSNSITPKGDVKRENEVEARKVEISRFIDTYGDSLNAYIPDGDREKISFKLRNGVVLTCDTSSKRIYLDDDILNRDINDILSALRSSISLGNLFNPVIYLK